MTDSKTPIDSDVLSALARRFVERGLLDEASELLQLALRLDPKNRGLQLSLAQIRNQQQAANGNRRRNKKELIHEEMRRAAIDAAHFFGLAALYEERGKRAQAAECLELARTKGVINPFIPKLAGKILLRQQCYEDAVEELRIARRYNPFDREISELLSSAEYECQDYSEALEAAIDAFLLLEDNDHEHAVVLKKRIRSLKHLQNLSSQDLVQLFHNRRDKLQTDFDRLEWQRERFLRAVPEAAHQVEHPPTRSGNVGRIELAGRLRRLKAFAALSDEAIFHLTQAVHQEFHTQGTKIFAYGSDSADLYVVEDGEIVIRRPTSYGTYDLGTLYPGDVFGEVSFILLSERSGEAVAAEETNLLRISARDLELMISDDPAFGLQIYKCFWRRLAQSLRETTEQLRNFFSDPSKPSNWLELRRHQGPGAAGMVEVEADDKVQLFREQGLSGAELSTLARFSSAKRYPDGTVLFHEGDSGDEMYIILEGHVMISKFIPGGGEEAVAILGRGEFFGEMSLLDGQPRSADAKAFKGPATLIALNQQALAEVLAMEPRSALDFIKLLCRLICHRLHEVDEKLIGWHIMSGGGSNTQSQLDEPVKAARA